MEFVWDEDERRRYIDTVKPEEERPLRQALFLMIPELPRSPLFAAWTKAAAAREKAAVAWGKADAAWGKAYAAYLASVNADTLHKRLCHPNCPWDGETIFARGKSIDVLNDRTP